ncbi:MAG: MerR family transcriptional regulator [Methylococcales bacterium]|nr:MerR family transcriptional regulator [Methylococcales bacterium]
MNSHDLLLVHTGTVIEEGSLTLGQLCRACGAHAEWIICLVEESIIEPQGDEIRSWRFSGASLVRARSALRLQRDLGINLAGIALVLDLLEELDNLRAQTR